MTKKKQQKYYVVRKGRKPGIYATWEECKTQVDQYPWAQYKSFQTQRDAQQAFEKSWQTKHVEKALDTVLKYLVQSPAIPMLTYKTNWVQMH